MTSNLREELYMLTGQVSNDIDYLYYLLIKDGTYREEIQKPMEYQQEVTVDTLEDWFNNLSEE